MIPKPTSDNQEVLFAALRKGHVDCIMFGWMSGFRTRVSQIRKMGVKFIPERVSKKNRHGNKITFVRHHLADKRKALNIYMGLQSKMKKAA